MLAMCLAMRDRLVLPKKFVRASLIKKRRAFPPLGVTMPHEGGRVDVSRASIGATGHAAWSHGARNLLMRNAQRHIQDAMRIRCACITPPSALHDTRCTVLVRASVCCGVYFS